ncbi:MAG: restriction endonuclease [Candidatus Omnitrophica bacterium]|nr:restriction endonuclease [Candidatus Omnitrophota bacterium]
MWEVEVRHDELHKYKVIRGHDKYIVEQKAEVLRQSWEKLWKKRTVRERRIRDKEEAKKFALEKTKEAEESLEQIQHILKHSLESQWPPKWDDLLNHDDYANPKPPIPRPICIPPEPLCPEVEFPKIVNFFCTILPSLDETIRKKRKEVIHVSFNRVWEQWKKRHDRDIRLNKESLMQYRDDLKRWEENRRSFIDERDKHNAYVTKLKEKYHKKERDTVAEYCDLILSYSKYPDIFPEKFDIVYNAETRMILVDYFLPAKEDLPTLREVKYNTSRGEFTEKYLPDSAFNKMYNNLLYQIVLRVTYEIYKSDVIQEIRCVAINGYVSFIDKGTGQKMISCILSLLTKKDEFEAINLEAIDPKECFRRLKGVGSSQLHGLAPVTPIITFNREDKRFVTPRDVIGQVDGATNIAAMDWQDFENLIRDIFDKEFCGPGAEVKITRASRDEGVDAVIFDPDPIRGGKIVIQAKRYTNTVGLSAVRDLYGTVVNEGAMKGILVTTADFGPDAYHFAKDKPITLLNGGNLLHLLEKHGHHAKIDLEEAKKIISEQQSKFD